MTSRFIASFLATLPLVSGQADGNPWAWDRLRRCDHTDYSPVCGACEGLGGYATADKADKITIPKCQVQESSKSPVRPVWSASFTEEASHEILIGKKNDPACFQSFPENVSTGPNCYKPQEVKLWSDMLDKRAIILEANQAGNAWNIAGNVTSHIYHQGQNMWIVNKLPLGITQTICTKPREGGDLSKPGVYGLQYNWVDNLFFVSTEVIDVEYGVGSMKLDHWAFGPHHVWTNPTTGMIVRMWQPFNGLQVFTPGAWKEGITAAGQAFLDELTKDGKTPPKAALPKGSTFRIKCGDDGFNNDPAPTDVSVSVGHNRATVVDLKRARTKVPRAEYKGDDFQSMSATLNKWLMKDAPNARDCEEFTVQELQALQAQLYVLRDTKLDGVYHGAVDNRRIRQDFKSMAEEWEELNSLAAQDPDLARMHRDGHCHETVMWYVHHLPQSVREAIKDKVALPLLSKMRHDVVDKKPHAAPLQRAYEEKVSCASCHSAVYPTTVVV